MFSSPPSKPATKQTRVAALDTIIERGSAVYQSGQANGSTAELTNTDIAERERERDGPKKVPRGQINSLAKMLFTYKANKSSQ